MKTTKIMLAFVGTVILTWMFVSFVYYLCSGSISFREACTENGILFLILMFGWIPAIVVCADLDDILSKQQHTNSVLDKERKHRIDSPYHTGVNF